MAKVALVFLPGLLIWAGQLQAGPKLEISPDKFDFGMVTQNSTVAFQTWVHSTGDDTLQIVGIKTGCACLEVSPESDRLAPGDSARVTLRWQIRQAAGNAVRSPYLFTNADSQPFRLDLTARVISAADTLSATFQPSKITVSDPSDSPDNPVRFTIRNNTDQDLTVELVSEPGPEYHLELPDTIYVNAAAAGTVTISGEFFGQELERSFTVELRQNSGVIERQTIPVVVGDFSFRPNVTTTK
jgi:hypothetical protein